MLDIGLIVIGIGMALGLITVFLFEVRRDSRDIWKTLSIMNECLNNCCDNEEKLINRMSLLESGMYRKHWEGQDILAAKTVLAQWRKENKLLAGFPLSEGFVGVNRVNK